MNNIPHHKFSFTAYLALILITAFAIRLLILNEFLTENPFAKAFFSDDWVYWIMAGAKAAGNWIEETPFLSAPLFPYLLGLLRWLGGTLETVYLVQLILGMLSILLIAIGTKKRFGETSGLIAAGLFAFSEESTMVFNRVMADSIQIFLVTFVWFLWCRLSDRKDPSLLHIFITGIFLGLLVLAWPPAQLLLIGFVFWLFFNSKISLANKLIKSAVGLIAGLLIISPATLHNYKTDGEFILVSANAGINLLQGNNNNAQGIITPIRGIRTDRQHMFTDATQVYKQAHGQVDSWKDIDNYFADQARGFIFDQPQKSIPLLIKKFYWFLSSQDYDNISVLSLEQDHGLYRWAKFVPIELPWLMGLVLLATIILIKNFHRYLPEFLIIGVAIFTCVIFHYSARYRLPAAPVLCILSAVAVTRWHKIPLAPILKFSIAFVPLLFIVINSMTGFADVEFMRKDTATKIAHAYVEAGDLYVRSNQFEQAKDLYQRGVNSDPTYETPYLRLAYLGLKIDQPDLTERWGKKVTEKLPPTSIAFKLLYNAQLRDKNYLAAAESLENLIQLMPNNLQLWQKLIWLLATNPIPEQRDPEKALDLSRQLLAHSNGIHRVGALVTLTAAQLSSDDKKSASHSIEKAIKMAKRSGLTDSLETLKDLQKDVKTKNIFDFQATPFKLDHPWDLSKPHPMDLIDF